MRYYQGGYVSILIGIVLTVLVTVGLGESYSFFMKVLRATPWIAALVAHGVISLCLYFLSRGIRNSLMLSGTKLMAWLPSLIVLMGSIVLALSTRNSSLPYAVSGFNEALYIIATLTLIPLFEEIVFRGGISPIMDRFVGSKWAVWFSALIFSAAHSHPTWVRFVDLKVGFILGPFLLSICCDMILRRWGRLWPAVAFHSACNATVYVFSALNPPWLSHFGALYM